MKVSTRDTLQVDARAATTTTLSEAESEFYLGDLLLHLNRLADADTHLSAAISKAPNLVPAQTSLGLLRVRQKRYDDAQALLKKAVDADSKSAMVNFYYAYVLERADADTGGALANTVDRYDTMRTFAKKAIDLAPKFVEGYALLSRIDLNAGENLDEAESTLKKAIGMAPGRDDLQMLLAQTYLRANRIPDARNVLTTVEHVSTNPDIRRRANLLLDQTEQSVSFTEITSTIEKEIAKEQPAAPPAPAPPPSRKVEDTVLEPLTPIAPAVEGEKVSGLLINMDCSDGLTLTIRTDRATMQLHSSEPQKIQFLSYTAGVSDNIRCGTRNPGEPIRVTYRPKPPGPGDPLVVEFLEK
jgi:tetratricopeptide (TPR) repeat protein